VSREESHSQLEQIRKLSTLSNGSSHSLAIVPRVTLAWSVLYIQMKLCQKTLRNFLDERNENDCFKTYYESFNLRADNLTFSALSIFKQICNGLQYIHDRAIVHHDVKPGKMQYHHLNTTAHVITVFFFCCQPMCSCRSTRVTR
jgi:serine/threonine protein kinase